MRKIRLGYVNWCNRLIKADRPICRYALYRDTMLKPVNTFMVDHRLYQETARKVEL